MTTQIKLIAKASRVMDIVHEMRYQGYVQGQDFDFAYHPQRYDNFSYEPTEPGYVVFAFYQDSLASWFAIKYS